MGRFFRISTMKIVTPLAIVLSIIYTTTVLWKKNEATQNSEPLKLTEHARKKLLQVVDAPKLLEDQLDLRPRTEFILTPSNLIGDLRRHPEGRWVVINFIKSALRNRNRRDMVRKTWASIKSVEENQIRSIFLVGTNDDPSIQLDIENESKEFGDILQIGLPDDYTHVPLKVLSGMQWASENLPKHWMYSSADDDIALHPFNFIKYLNTYSDLPSDGASMNSFSNLPIMCIYSFNAGDVPARNPKSKWFMSSDIYPPSEWPPYCRGGWYTMTVDLASKLYEVSKRTAYLYLDDVWITGLMRLKLFVQLTNSNDSSLLDYGIAAAPLSIRSDKDFVERTGEDDFTKVIVSHVWGNIAGKAVDVPLALSELFEKWKSALAE